MVNYAFNIFRLAGDFIHVLSIFLLFLKMRKTRSCAGLSLKSQLVYMLVYLTRYLDLLYVLRIDQLHLMRFNVLHIYNFFMKVLFIGSQAAVLYYSWFRFRPTYNAKLDTVRIELLILPSLVLAFFFEESGPKAGWLLFLREYFWTFSILLESVAILPQMFLLNNTGEAETITTHYLLCLGMYRALYLVNWMYRTVMGRAPEAIVFLAGILQTALYSDFFYIYYKRYVVVLVD